MQIITKFFSRKLAVAVFGVLSACYSIMHVMQMGKTDMVTIASVVSLALSISVIVVTYITGVAKIDVSAQMNLNK